MEKKNYKSQLQQTKEVLKDFEIKLQECMLNLMMYGEMSEWNREAKDKDEIIIDNRLMEASNDKNVQELLRLHKTVILVTSKII